MDNFECNVEIDSVVDLEVEVREDPTDPIAKLPRAGTRQWSGSNFGGKRLGNGCGTLD